MSFINPLAWLTAQTSQRLIDQELSTCYTEQKFKDEPIQGDMIFKTFSALQDCSSSIGAMFSSRSANHLKLTTAKLASLFDRIVDRSVFASSYAKNVNQYEEFELFHKNYRAKKKIFFIAKLGELTNELHLVSLLFEYYVIPPYSNKVSMELLLACKNRDLLTVEKLVKHPDIDINQCEPTHRLKNTLEIALSQSDFKIAGLLIDYGAWLETSVLTDLWKDSNIEAFIFLLSHPAAKKIPDIKFNIFHAIGLPLEGYLNFFTPVNSSLDRSKILQIIAYIYTWMTPNELEVFQKRFRP